MKSQFGEEDENNYMQGSLQVTEAEALWSTTGGSEKDGEMGQTKNCSKQYEDMSPEDNEKQGLAFCQLTQINSDMRHSKITLGPFKEYGHSLWFMLQS